MESYVHLLVLGLCLLYTPNVLSAMWDPIPFLEIHSGPEINFTNTVSDGQVIDMNEEMGKGIQLAKINYMGAGVPNIGRFLTGIPSYLDAKITGSSGNYIIVIGENQNYEVSENRNYNFEVQIVEASVTYSAMIYLRINNIDDNPPTIEARTCKHKELDEGPTECRYTVRDADGFISTNVMTYAIDPISEADYFKIRELDKSEFEIILTVDVIKELNFDISQLHTFTLKAFDSLPNEGSAFVVIQVEDVPNMPPVWRSIFASQQFDEKTSQSFTVRAVDGDTQINKEINYRLDNLDIFGDLFSIGVTDGVLKVEPIDRDTLKREVFTFDITAYKVDCENTNDLCSDSASIIIIVNDINDNRPEPGEEYYEITIPEETFENLDFIPIISFNDIDLGNNARYNVELIEVEPKGARAAFTIIPRAGYQEQEFVIAITNASMLDYDIPNGEWQNIIMEIEAKEIVEPFNSSRSSVKIILQNWNDELPIFEKGTIVEKWVEETVEAGYEIEQLLATDRDIGDSVKHSIDSVIYGYLQIDEATGLISVKDDDAFDFNRQSQLIVQVTAEDTFMSPTTNKAYAQLIINLIDINNKPPSIQMPRGTPSTEENVPEGYEILKDDLIQGTDPDSDAVLVFSIDWDKTYATKQSRRVPEDKYRNCLYINPTTGDQNRIFGQLIVKEIAAGVTIDFEEFDVLYLMIGLTDTNQTLPDNYVEGVLTIVIEDLNDNAPEWVPNTLTTPRIVRENADEDTFVGSVQAIDIDGPLFNVVRYQIIPRNNTPDNWILIHPDDGILTVGKEEIDADLKPHRLYLYYTLIASDCPDVIEGDCWNTTGDIAIFIRDTNSKTPMALEDMFPLEIVVREDADTGHSITTIISEDNDRDEIYHTIHYTIDFRMNVNQTRFFMVDTETGEVRVNLQGEPLDRDRGVEFHDLYINLIDNFAQQGDTTQRSNRTQLRIILEDVNDNAPEFPPYSAYRWDVSENTKHLVEFSPNVTAPDIDQPNHDNSRVFYQVLNMTAKNRADKIFSGDFIDILSPDNISGILFANKDLKDFWGTWDIYLKACDFGEDQQCSEQNYEFVIIPYNYNKPKFIFPSSDNALLRLTKESARPGARLTYTSGRLLDELEAEDPDGLDAGVVTFEIIGPELAVEYFTIENENFEGNTARLLLKKDLSTISSFDLVIRATDKGTDPGPEYQEISCKVVFVNTQGFPFYPETTDTVAFIEFEQGMIEPVKLMDADDEKNAECHDTSDCFTIYYYIMEGETKDHFELDKETNMLSVVIPLNRTERPVHIIRVAATNSETAPDAITHPDSVLTLTIQVREADPRPHFERSPYTAGISSNYEVGRHLLDVKATHSEHFPIVYRIIPESMNVSHQSLENNKDTAFILHSTTGAITLNFQPQDGMEGMFEFNIEATDNATKTGKTDVKIFIIGRNNRVSFIFENPQEEVTAKQNRIEEILSESFGYICNIDSIGRATDSNGNAIEGKTNVLVHFIDDYDLPVEASVIESALDNVSLMRRLREELLKEELSLEDFGSSGSGSNNNESLERMLQIILIVVSTVLGGLCIVLLVAYCIRTRTLNNRLKALSTTKFGSMDSGMNRFGVAKVPGTNKHAYEGSNPVWKEEITVPTFDTVSTGSGDSDLIGVENNSQFAYDNAGVVKEKY